MSARFVMMIGLLTLAGACGTRERQGHAGLEATDNGPCILSIETLSKAASCLSDNSGGVLTAGYAVTSSHVDQGADVIAIVDGAESVVGHIGASEWTITSGVGQVGGEVVLNLGLGNHAITLCAQVGIDRACDATFGVAFTCAPDPS